MKRVFLFFMFLCMISFSEFEFGDLKWGSSREEVKDYLVNTFGVRRNFIHERKGNKLGMSLAPVTYAEISLKEVEFEFNSDGELCSWSGDSYSDYKNYDNIKNYLKKIYNLNEGKVKGTGTDTLSKLIKDKSDMVILFKDEKIIFIGTDHYYYLKDYKKNK